LSISRYAAFNNYNAGFAPSKISESRSVPLLSPYSFISLRRSLSKILIRSKNFSEALFIESFSKSLIMMIDSGLEGLESRLIKAMRYFMASFEASSCEAFASFSSLRFGAGDLSLLIVYFLTISLLAALAYTSSSFYCKNSSSSISVLLSF
jgi:hypothetical protein